MTSGRCGLAGLRVVAMAHAALAGPRRFLSRASVVCIVEGFADLTVSRGATS